MGCSGTFAQGSTVVWNRVVIAFAQPKFDDVFAAPECGELRHLECLQLRPRHTIEMLDPWRRLSLGEFRKAAEPVGEPGQDAVVGA
jgi:hypothetical protein